MLKSYSLIALGSAVGGVSRYWLSGVIALALGETFPWGTVIVNITGCLLIGFLAAMTGPDGRWFWPAEWRQFAMVGICGGYTTFSSFSLQTLTLLQGGEWLAATGNVLISVLCCMLAVWLGHVLASSLATVGGP